VAASAACRGWCGRTGFLERGQQLGTHQLGHGYAAAHVANRVLYVGGRFLAVVDELTVEIDLEAALAYGADRDTNFAVPTSDDLGCQTGSLPEVASRNAILNLYLNLAFGHGSSPS